MHGSLIEEQMGCRLREASPCARDGKSETPSGPGAASKFLDASGAWRGGIQLRKLSIVVRIFD